MHLIPVTEEAWAISAKFDRLEKFIPRKLEHGLMDIAGFACGGMLVLGMLVVDSVAHDEFSAAHLIAMAWAAAVSLVSCGIAAILYLRRRSLNHAYAALIDSGEIVEVHYKIVRRWARIRREVGLEPSEPCARLEEFPEVVRQAVDLRKAVLSNIPQDLKELLSQRITQIMREALVPLALELRLAQGLESLGHEWEAAAREEFARWKAIPTQVADELQADHLLLTT